MEALRCYGLCSTNCPIRLHFLTTTRISSCRTMRQGMRRLRKCVSPHFFVEQERKQVRTALHSSILRQIKWPCRRIWGDLITCKGNTLNSSATGLGSLSPLAVLFKSDRDALMDVEQELAEGRVWRGNRSNCCSKLTSSARCICLIPLLPRHLNSISTKLTHLRPFTCARFRAS